MYKYLVTEYSTFLIYKADLLNLKTDCSLICNRFFSQQIVISRRKV